MNTVWHSLLWKEWHENRWKLASLTVILFAVPLSISWMSSEWFLGTAAGVTVWYFLFAPIYISAGVCASEASGGTLPFLQAMPVDRRKWALAKFAMGWFTLAMPLLLLLFFFVACCTIHPDVFGAKYRENLEDFASHFGALHYSGLVGWGILCAIIAPLSTFIWSLAAGVKCRRELWVIAVSIGVFSGLWFLLFVLENHYRMEEGQLLLFALMLLPGGFMIGFSNSGPAFPTPLILLAALFFHAGLLAWYLTQFGRSTRYAGHSPKAVAVYDPASVAIRKPRQSKTSAMLWMQMQEIAPLAGACVALSLLLALLLAGFITEDFRGNSFVERLGNNLAGMAGTMGFFFAILIGVGVFLRDLEPGLNTFWRSRPIPASHWFWTKYLSAFAMLAVAISIPMLLALYLNADRIWQELGSSSTGVIAVSVLCTFAFTSVYTTTVAVTSLVRHAIYGCLLSIGIVLISYIMAARWLSDCPNEIAALGVGVTLQILLIVVTTLIAWLAVTRDWGWKR